jgi:hypothetical protein
MPIRKIFASGSCLEYPEDTPEDQTFIGSATASIRPQRDLGNERLDLLPLLVA